jgi:hypothetical protein
MSTGLFLFIIGIILFLGIGVHGYMHELVHVQNFKQVGIESHLEFSGTQVLTVPEGNYKTNEDAQTTRLSNAMNEAVAYNVTPLVFMLSGVIIASALYVKGGKE